MSDPAVTDTQDLDEVGLPEVTIQPGQRTADVQISGRRVRLAVPKSATVATECVGMLANSPTRGLAACLAACWQAGGSKGAPKASLAACNYNVGMWGGKVLDELLSGKRIKIDELRPIGMVAYTLLAGSLITEEEVKSTVDFTEAPGGSTG